MNRLDIAASVGGAAPPTATATVRTIGQIVREVDTFGTLARALDAVRLSYILDRAASLTLFAPTDEAFAKLPAGLMDGLFTRPEWLAGVIMCHVVMRPLYLADIVDARGACPRTLGGQLLQIMVHEGRVRVEQARVLGAELHASNGVVLAVDQVLMVSPPATRR